VTWDPELRGGRRTVALRPERYRGVGERQFGIAFIQRFGDSLFRMSTCTLVASTLGQLRVT
jgi:hypothetical protein